MKGIALSTIAIFIIAIVSITLLISFVSSNLPASLRKGYCSMMISLVGFLPLPEHLKPSLPPYCQFSTYQRTVIIETPLPERISFEIASHILACWKQTGERGKTKTSYCYELVLKRIEGSVDEDSVKLQLPSEYQEVFVWEAGIIESPKSIGIYYDENVGKVIVV